MACPGVSGTSAQLYQAYKDNNGGTEPAGGLLKAILMNSCDDLGNPGPDYRYGFGRINARKAVEIITQDQMSTSTISQSGSNNTTITVPNNVAQVKIMLYWTDVPGSVLSSRALVNNLDMTATQGANNYQPLVLDHTPSATNLNTNAAPGTDTLNNVEQIVIDNPSTTDITVTVSGTDIPMGPQTYYIVYEFIYDEIVLTYPQGGEPFVPGESELIRWDASEGTQTFDVEYSTDGGASWQVISQNVNASLRQVSWTVPNTVTGRALVRVSRGTQTSQSTAHFTILDVPQNIAVAWACPDSVSLTWSPVSGATGYIIHQLGQKYMDSVGTTTATSYTVVNVNPNDEYWFSVSALGPDNAKGRRAVAINKQPGTFNCVLPTDAQSALLISPSHGLLPSCHSYTSVEVKVQLTNGGTQAISQVPLHYSYDNGATVTDTLHGTLAPGTDTVYTFAQDIAITGTSVHDIIFWTSLGGDGNRYNDTLTASFQISGSTTTQPLPYVENFDAFNTCSITPDCEQTTCNLSSGWINVSNGTFDDIDWRTDNNGTFSSNTGPPSDHTTGSSSGNYLYTEASGGCNYQWASLITPCFDLTSATLPQASFWYHMMGTDIGELHVDVLFDGHWQLDVIPALIGEQSTQWNQGTINLSAYTGQVIALRFRGSTAGDFRGDIAIDDFSILESNAAPGVAFSIAGNVGCVNTPVQLIDQSNNVPTGWNWQITPSTFVFLNGTTASSQNIEVAFTAMGTYDVKLVATNSFGSDSLTQVGFVTINNGESLPYVEDFTSFVPTGWIVDNPDADTTWAQSGAVTGPSGSTSTAAMVDNFNYDAAGEEDGLTTERLGLQNSPNAVLLFDVAYARYSSSLFETLRVEISDDCGTSYSTVYTRSGTNLATVPDQTNFFVPASASDWRTDTVDLSAYSGESIYVRFVNVNGYGNALYLDNVRVVDSLTSAPIASMNISDPLNCIGTQTVFSDASVGQGLTYSWDFGTNASPATATTAGPHSVQWLTPGTKTISLTVSNGGGSNTSTQSFDVKTTPVANFSFVEVGNLQVDFTDQSANAPNYWSWNFGDNNTSTQQNPSHTYAATGMYTVTLQAGNECDSTDTSYTVNVMGVGINELTRPAIKLYPNPADEEVIVSISIPNINEVSYKISDLSGRMVLEHQPGVSLNTMGEDSFGIGVSHLSPGVYILQVEDAHYNWKEKLIIE